MATVRLAELFNCFPRPADEFETSTKTVGSRLDSRSTRTTHKTRTMILTCGSFLLLGFDFVANSLFLLDPTLPRLNDQTPPSLP